MAVFFDLTNGSDSVVFTPGQLAGRSVRGLDGNDTLIGSTDAEFINGNQGEEIIRSGGGRDTLYGGQGNDSIVGSDDIDSIFGDRGSDTLIGAAGDDTILGDTGAQATGAPPGTTFNDLIRGGLGNDSLNGGFGNDTVFGGSGNDTLDGAAGIDALTGGPGSDVFQYPLFAGPDNQDTITDFTPGQDVVAISSEPFRNPPPSGGFNQDGMLQPGPLPQSLFLSGPGITAPTSGQKFVFDTNTQNLYFFNSTTNNPLAPVTGSFLIATTPGVNLTANDIIIY